VIYTDLIGQILPSCKIRCGNEETTYLQAIWVYLVIKGCLYKTMIL